jgi:hypothetical protein
MKHFDASPKPSGIKYGIWHVIPAPILASSAFRGLKSLYTHDVCRLPDGSQWAVKVAPRGSEKEMQLRHEAKGYLTVRELWKAGVPEVLLAGPLLAIGVGYGIGTALVPGHPLQPGVDLLDHLRSNENMQIHPSV